MLMSNREKEIYDLVNALGLPKNAQDELLSCFRVMPANKPGAKLVGKAQSVLNAMQTDYEKYKMKPYLCGTQSKQYISSLIKPEYQTACVVAASGNTTIELLRNGIKEITAVDINDLQILIYELRLAAIKGLNNVEFENFLINHSSRDFLSHKVFLKSVKPHLTSEEVINFWDTFLSLNTPDEIYDYYLKGGLEHTSPSVARRVLPFLKKGGNYFSARQNLKLAKIETQIYDIIDFLVKHPEQQFDYIDFANILLFIGQDAINENNLDKLSEALEKIKLIYENNLKQGGTFVVDYMMGFEPKDLSKNGKSLTKIQEQIMMIYSMVYEKLQSYFEIQSMSFEKAAKATPLDGPKDTIIYVKK